MDSVYIPYIPELDDAQEAAKLLRGFNALWRGATAGQRNRQLLTILEAIYVHVECREIVGLRPRQTLLTLFEAVEDNGPAILSSNRTGNFGTVGGDGGEPAPLLPYYPTAVQFPAPPDPSLSIGQLVREQRVHLGISQSELAERVSVSSRTIRAWEWGDSAPKGHKFASLFGVLGIELA